MSFKQRTFKYWIHIYSYNVRLILPIKRNLKNDIVSNVILLLLSPWILGYYLFCVVYEKIYAISSINKLMKQDLQKMFEHELAICSISKNEGPYIKEWLEFHRLIGISKFYFYDNESTDNTMDILEPYIKCGLVEYHLIKGVGKQLTAYNEVLRKHRYDARYIAFIDMDEYIVPESPYMKISELVTHLINLYGQGAAGIGINWAIFGSAGKTERTMGTITGTYTQRAEMDYWGNKHIKSLVNPRFVTYYISPHYPSFRLGAYNISVIGERLIGWATSIVSFNNIRINHYYTKSYEDFCVKKSRGLGDRLGRYDDEQFYKYDRNEVDDNSMQVYQDMLEKQLNSYV